VNGHKVHVSEQALPGFKFPYRVSPGNLSVSRSIGDFGTKNPLIGGINGAIINKPCVNQFQINEKSNFSFNFTAFNIK